MLFLYPFLSSHNFGLFRCNPFSIVSVEGLKHNSKLSCHGQLCYKRLAHSLPLQYFPCFCERTPTLVSAAEIDSERAILKNDPSSGHDRSAMVSLSLSVFEKPKVFCLKLYENIPLTTTSMTQYDFSHCRFTLVDLRHVSII